MEEESPNPPHASRPQHSQNFPSNIAAHPSSARPPHHLPHPHHHHHLHSHPQQQQQQQQQQEQQHPHHPQQQQQHHALTLSLPTFDPANQPTIPRGHMDGENKPSREDCWSEGATFTLIEAWGDRYVELNRGNLKQKHWKEVADAVNNREEGKPPKTDVQCKNRLDTLKKKYKLEKNKLLAGGTCCKWPYYLKLDELIGNSKKDKHPEILKQAKQRRDNYNYNYPNNNNNNNVNNGILRGEGEEVHQNKFYDNNNNINNNSLSNSKWKESPDMTDSCPDGTNEGGEGRSGRKRRTQEEPLKDLAKAILKFGKAYERVEMAKQQGLMELEKQRMEFAKEIEIQRMQMFMQTQLEVARLKRGKQGNTEHYL